MIEIRQLTKVFKLSKKQIGRGQDKKSQEDGGRPPGPDSQRRRNLRTSGTERGREDDNAPLYFHADPAHRGGNLCQWT